MISQTWRCYCQLRLKFHVCCSLIVYTDVKFGTLNVHKLATDRVVCLGLYEDVNFTVFNQNGILCKVFDL